MLNCTVDTMELYTKSGEIMIGGISIDTLQAETTSGDMKFELAIGLENAILKTTSGDIELVSFDSDDIRITTTTGDVSGSLMNGKKFVCETTTGHIKVPADTPDNGTCTIQTTTGDIEIKVE